MKLEIRITLKKKTCSGLNPEAHREFKTFGKGDHALEVLHSQNLLEGKKSNVCRHKCLSVDLYNIMHFFFHSKSESVMFFQHLK
jgi:hypothetical protein